MGEKFLRGVGGISRVLAGILHGGPFFIEFLAGEIQDAAQRCRVEFRHVFRDEHHVIGRLIEDQQLVVAVVHQSACRVYHSFKECVAVGMFLVFVISYLKVEQSEKVDDHNQGYESAYDEFPFLKNVVFPHFDLRSCRIVTRLSVPRSRRKVRAVLPSVSMNISFMSAKEKYSIEKTRKENIPVMVNRYLQ